MKITMGQYSIKNAYAIALLQLVLLPQKRRNASPWMARF
jgi:hypothetical protein